MEIQEQQQEAVKEFSELEFLVNIQLSVEKFRVASQVRNSHLAKGNRHDALCEEAWEKLKDLEGWIDGKVAQEVQKHGAYHWFSKIKGIGKENIGKVIGLIDVREAPYVSSLWKYAGYHVVDGMAPKRKKGEKTTYNKDLRSMCYRLGTSLMRAKGKYYAFYQEAKIRDREKLSQKGITVLPEARLQTIKKRKENKDKDLSGEYISEGHVHNRVLRKTVKLFLSHLWMISREAQGLTVNKPYVHAQLGHEHYYDPWEFTDR
tara:strand:- start:1026 stop:1808 length:783 start_codon:yes stop_codon:yes gene_type:complete